MGSSILVSLTQWLFSGMVHDPPHREGNSLNKPRNSTAMSMKRQSEDTTFVIVIPFGNSIDFEKLEKWFYEKS